VLERLSGRGKRILCNSDQTREQVEKFFGYKGSTVWYPMDTSRFCPLDKFTCRHELGFCESDRIGIFVGSTQPTKNFNIVRRLVDELNGVKWVLALRGQVPPDLNGDDRISLFQNASPDILPMLYNAADFSVCPSLYESFGYVVAESLCCGTPVIASPSGASLKFLGEPPMEEFLIHRPNAVGDYVAAIRTILGDSESFRQLVITRIRPKIEQIMAPENWWNQFFDLSGL